eukprot:m.95866 g.95866  ORF g.95866 m.95866 type:complete len:315 (-) comp16619_c0_seq1:136-1080(-)
MWRYAIGAIGYGGAATVFGLRIQNLGSSLLDHISYVTCNQPECLLTPKIFVDVKDVLQQTGDLKDTEVVVFVTRGLSAMSAGSLALGGGVALGIPRTFLATSMDDPIMRKLKLRTASDRHLDTAEDTGAAHDNRSDSSDAASGTGEEANRRARELLFRSEQSKGFTIAHEVGHLVHEDGVISAALEPCMTAASTWTFLSATAKFSARGPSPLARVAKLIVGLPTIGLAYIFSKWGQELRADNYAIRNGYGAGAMEFYRERSALNCLLAESSPHPSILDAVLEKGDVTSPTNLLTHPPLSLRRWLCQRTMRAMTS